MYDMLNIKPKIINKNNIEPKLPSRPTETIFKILVILELFVNVMSQSIVIQKMIRLSHVNWTKLMSLVLSGISILFFTKIQHIIQRTNICLKFQIFFLSAIYVYICTVHVYKVQEMCISLSNENSAAKTTHHLPLSIKISFYL